MFVGNRPVCVITDYQVEVDDQYVCQTPDGIRADVGGKGAWKETK